MTGTQDLARCAEEHTQIAEQEHFSYVRLGPPARGSPPERRGLLARLNDVLLAWGRWLDGRGESTADSE
ncbi:MAG: hypothetical protein DIU80_022120 [Chloroflexota bacterium]